MRYLDTLKALRSRSTILELIERCVNLGCKMLSLGIDTWAVQPGLKTFGEEYSGLR